MSGPNNNKALDAACARLAEVMPTISESTDDESLIQIDRLVQVFDGDFNLETGMIDTLGVCPGYLAKLKKRN